MEPKRELLALFWTLAGVYPGDAELSRFRFTDRVTAAARAGFNGIGLWHTDLDHVAATTPLAEMKRILDGSGMTYIELEFLTDWFAEGARRRESDSRRHRLLEAAAALGRGHVKIGDFYNSPCSMERLVDAFGGLCLEAKRYGARIGFEVMECSMVHTIGEAAELVRRAGASNGGLVIDMVQVVNLGMTEADLRGIPPSSLVSLELDDGLLPGTPGHDASARRFCGEGEFDITGFVRLMDSAGYSGPWAVEVFNREYAGLPLDELARRAFTTTTAALARARGA